jgi:hypothetical protein
LQAFAAAGGDNETPSSPSYYTATDPTDTYYTCDIYRKLDFGLEPSCKPDGAGIKSLAADCLQDALPGTPVKGPASITAFTSSASESGLVAIPSSSNGGSLTSDAMLGRAGSDSAGTMITTEQLHPKRPAPPGLAPSEVQLPPKLRLKGEKAPVA